MTSDDKISYYEHEPVLLDEAVSELITDKNGIYVDCTLGGGGHATEILSRIGENATLYGIDQDDEALEAASARIGKDPRFIPIKGNFGYLSTLLPPKTHGEVSGLLLDLGISTHQITDPERGFSFKHDGPLDMRMSNLRGVTAHQVANEYGYEDLRDIIFHYGEERKSREIARAIINARPIKSTGQLKNIIKTVVKGPHQIKSVARVFQGIRIEVNRELDMLREVLSQSLNILKNNGRIVAISYHSLEDRIVKRFFKTGNHEGQVEKDFYGNPISPIHMLTDNFISPSEEDIAENPAARSAKLRVAETIESGEG